MNQDPAADHGATSQAFAWDDALAFALGVLRWPPDTVWGATPRELALAAHSFSTQQTAPPDAGVLAALMAAFPDTGHPDDQM